MITRQPPRSRFIRGRPGETSCGRSSSPGESPRREPRPSAVRKPIRLHLADSGPEIHVSPTRDDRSGQRSVATAVGVRDQRFRRRRPSLPRARAAAPFGPARSPLPGRATAAGARRPPAPSAPADGERSPARAGGRADDATWWVADGLLAGRAPAPRLLSRELGRAHRARTALARLSPVHAQPARSQAMRGPPPIAGAGAAPAASARYTQPGPAGTLTHARRAVARSAVRLAIAGALAACLCGLAAPSAALAHAQLLGDLTPVRLDRANAAKRGDLQVQPGRRRDARRGPRLQRAGRRGRRPRRSPTRKGRSTGWASA